MTVYSIPCCCLDNYSKSKIFDSFSQPCTNYISNYNDNYALRILHARNPLTVNTKKSISIIKAKSHWIFKHFFEDMETFRELADYYDKDSYRFVLKTPANGIWSKSFWRKGDLMYCWWKIPEGMSSNWTAKEGMPRC